MGPNGGGRADAPDRRTTARAPGRPAAAWARPIRPGTPADAARRRPPARRADRPSGFLSFLGPRFLRRLYRRICLDPARSCWWRRGHPGADRWWASSPDRPTCPACTGRSCGATAWRPPSPALGHLVRALAPGARDPPARVPGRGRRRAGRRAAGHRRRPRRARAAASGQPWSRRSSTSWPPAGVRRRPRGGGGRQPAGGRPSTERAGFVTVERFELHPGTESLLMQWDRPGAPPRPRRPRRHERPARSSSWPLAVTLVATPLAMVVAGRFGVVDRPGALKPQADRSPTSAAWRSSPACVVGVAAGRPSRGRPAGRRPWPSAWPTTGSTCPRPSGWPASWPSGWRWPSPSRVHLAGAVGAVRRRGRDRAGGQRREPHRRARPAGRRGGGRGRRGVRRGAPRRRPAAGRGPGRGPGRLPRLQPPAGPDLPRGRRLLPARHRPRRAPGLRPGLPGWPHRPAWRPWPWWPCPSPRWPSPWSAGPGAAGPSWPATAATPTTGWSPGAGRSRRPAWPTSASRPPCWPPGSWPPPTAASMTAAVVVDVAAAAAAGGRGPGHRRPHPRPGGPRVSRIYLSPPDVGDDERRMLLEAFDSNWIAPLGPGRRRLRARGGPAGRASATPWPCPAGPPPSTWPCSWSGWAPATRCWCPPSPSWPRPTPSPTSGPPRSSSTARPTTGRSTPALVAEELDERARPGGLPRARGDRRPLRAVRRLRRPGRAVRPSTGSRWSRTPPRRWAPPTGAGRPGRSARPACSRSTATRSSPPAAGGMLVSDDAELVDRARYLATQAREPVPPLRALRRSGSTTG